jgi:hypothetical protein
VEHANNLWSWSVSKSLNITFFSAAKASDKYAGYMAKDDLERALVEATANENWNVSNTLLLTISDSTYQMPNIDRISEFFMLKLNSKAQEWRRILKTLNAIDFLLKNGSPAMLNRIS